MDTPTLKDHRSLFRQLLAGMYDAVIITDPNGHVIELNPRAKEYFGYEREEVADRPVSLFIPGVTPAVVQRIRHGLGAGRRVMLDAACQRKDASGFPAEVTVSVIDLMEADDLVFTVRDTSRRHRQLSIFRSKENAFAASQAALFACDADGAFRQVNAAFLETFGLGSEEAALSRKFSEVLDAEPLQALFSRALDGVGGALRVVAENEDGATEQVEVRLAPDFHGTKIRGVVGSAFRA